VIGLAALLLLVGAFVFWELFTREDELPEPTDEQCLEFAQRIEETINAGDPTFFNRSLDANALLSRVVKGLKNSKMLKLYSRKGFAADLRKNRLGETLCQALGDSGNYKLLRIRRAEDGPRAIFRQLTVDGGLGYHELFLIQTRRGKVKIADIYFYTSGERLSRTMRRLYLIARRAGGMGRHTPSLKTMIEHLKGGRYDEALAFYRSLPAALRKEKDFLMLRLRCVTERPAAEENNAEYLEVLTDFRKYYPDDPCLDLMLIDFHLTREEYQQSFRCLDRLDERVGGDPYLDVMRGNIHLIRGDLAQAGRLYNQALREERGLTDAYDGLLAISLQEKNFEEAARILTMFESEFGIDLADLRRQPDYAEFLRSAEGQRWLSAPREESGPATGEAVETGEAKK